MNPKTISRSASHTDSQGRHLISLMLVLLPWGGSGSHVLCLSSVHCSFVKPHFVGRESRPGHQLLGNTEIWKPHKYRGDLETSQTKTLRPPGTCWLTVLLYRHMHTNMYTYTHVHRHAHIHMCTQACTRVHKHIHTHAHRHAHIHTCTQIWYTHAHGTAHTYSMLNVCAHTYMHTQPAVARGGCTACTYRPQYTHMLQTRAHTCPGLGGH